MHKNARPLQVDEVPESARKAFDFSSQEVTFKTILRGRPHRRMTIRRTCPNCGRQERVWIGTIRNCIKNQALTGLCFDCSRRVPRDHPPRGEASSNWKGGRIKTKRGYVFVKSNQPYIQDAFNYISEHRLVMEGMIGRKLFSWESVHHKNGIKDDNRPQNLELWAGNHSNGNRYSDLSITQIEDLIAFLQSLLKKKQAVSS